MNESTLNQAEENAAVTTTESEMTGEQPSRKKHSKKKITIFITIAVVIVAATIMAIILIPSKFDKVMDECVQIAGRLSSGKDYFTIDTLPDEFESMDDELRAVLLPGTQEKALDAIRYANNELGFPGSVYSQMMSTTALMGRQSEETNKYKVAWSYHPDTGLEVTYTKK